MTRQWLICREPVHIGGSDSSSRGNNNPIFRLADRSPAIPGSSLRGALREKANNNNTYRQYVNTWFGQEDQEEQHISPGQISIGWGWPLWWPVHVLGYGNWWVSCLSWLNRFQQTNLNAQQIYITDSNLSQQSVYFRWLKLTNVQYTSPENLPGPPDVPSDRRIIIPDHAINVIVDMGLVRQPRVKLLDEPNEQGTLVKNLFAVEGIPPGAVFVFNWTSRNNLNNQDQWLTFLEGEHYLGGLWSVGYGRIKISKIEENN